MTRLTIMLTVSDKISLTISNEIHFSNTHDKFRGIFELQKEINVIKKRTIVVKLSKKY